MLAFDVSRRSLNNMHERLSRLFAHLWAHRVQFARYTVTGFSAVVLDMGSLYILKEWFHFRPVWAIVVNQGFLANYVFLLNKKWSFQAQGRTHRQVIRFYILSAFNYTVSVTWMGFFSHIFGEQWYLLIRLANIGLATGWNFLLYKFWVYRH